MYITVESVEIQTTDGKKVNKQLWNRRDRGARRKYLGGGHVLRKET